MAPDINSPEIQALMKVAGPPDPALMARSATPDVNSPEIQALMKIAGPPDPALVSGPAAPNSDDQRSAGMAQLLKTLGGPLSGVGEMISIGHYLSPETTNSLVKDTPEMVGLGVGSGVGAAGGPGGSILGGTAGDMAGKTAGSLLDKYVFGLPDAEGPSMPSVTDVGRATITSTLNTLLPIAGKYITRDAVIPLLNTMIPEVAADKAKTILLKLFAPTAKELSPLGDDASKTVDEFLKSGYVKFDESTTPATLQEQIARDVGTSTSKGVLPQNLEDLTTHLTKIEKSINDANGKPITPRFSAVEPDLQSSIQMELKSAQRVATDELGDPLTDAAGNPIEDPHAFLIGQNSDGIAQKVTKITTDLKNKFAKQYVDEAKDLGEQIAALDKKLAKMRDPDSPFGLQIQSDKAKLGAQLSEASQNASDPPLYFNDRRQIKIQADKDAAAAWEGDSPTVNAVANKIVANGFRHNVVTSAAALDPVEGAKFASDTNKLYLLNRMSGMVERAAKKFDFAKYERTSPIAKVVTKGKELTVGLTKVSSPSTPREMFTDAMNLLARNPEYAGRPDMQSALTKVTGDLESIRLKLRPAVPLAAPLASRKVEDYLDDGGR